MLVRNFFFLLLLTFLLDFFPLVGEISFFSFSHLLLLLLLCSSVFFFLLTRYCAPAADSGTAKSFPTSCFHGAETKNCQRKRNIFIFFWCLSSLSSLSSLSLSTCIFSTLAHLRKRCFPSSGGKTFSFSFSFSFSSSLLDRWKFITFYGRWWWWWWVVGGLRRRKKKKEKREIFVFLTEHWHFLFFLFYFFLLPKIYLPPSPLPTSSHLFPPPWNCVHSKQRWYYNSLVYCQWL